MQNGFVSLTRLLEELIEKSPLSKMLVIDTLGSEPAASVYLLARHEDAKQLEALERALASGSITPDKFNEEFPKVPYMIVNANYGQLTAPSDIAPSDIRRVELGSRQLLIQGLECKLFSVTMELCQGAGSYVCDDDKIVSELLARVYFSADGTPRDVTSYASHELLGPPLKPGASAEEVFRTFERHVMSYSLRS